MAGSAAALMLVVAPAAHAGPEDTPGCTTTYVNTLARSSSPEFIEYTPPADVDVNGNAILGTAFFVVDATVDYVICVA